MSKISSIDKGKRGEREIIAILQPLVSSVYLDLDLEPPLLERNLMQSARGGFDIAGLDWIAMEVKRQETQAIPKWWKQTCEQAIGGREPVLFYRRNRVPWRVVMFGTLDAGETQIRVPVNISIGAFGVWFKSRLRFEIEKGKY